MLSRLTIENYALIDSLDITFPEGLIIITGETGAGKSILLGALSLLLGKKGDSTLFSDDKRNCVVEAEFDNGMIIRRVINPNGRSRSFLNDEPISLAALSEVSNKIIDIHAQHQHLLLADSEYQLSVLDYFAGNSSLLEEYKATYKEYVAKSSEIASIEKDIEKAQSSADYIQFQLQQLQSASLSVGEVEELESEQVQLANAEEIRFALFQSSGLFNGGDTSLVQNLKEVESLLSKNVGYLPALGDIKERVHSARIELADIEEEISILSEKVEVSPKRLEEVEERLSFLYSLMKKHHCDTIEQLIGVRESYEGAASNIGTMVEQREVLLKELARIGQKRDILASELSVRRKNAASTLAQSIQESIRSLEIAEAVFKVELFKEPKITLSGWESVKFLFSANSSKLPAEVSKVASGGELSRIMLSVKALMSQYTELPTMIFDEIDTGVSGKIADKMGAMIGKMADRMQIFSITHLPQIASKRGTHFLVYKENIDGKVRTRIKELSQQERVMEIARMLSGSQLSSAAILNAETLLKENFKTI